MKEVLNNNIFIILIKVIDQKAWKHAKAKLDKRMNQFVEFLEQIKNISNELYNDSEDTSSSIVVDETDLSIKKLEELHSEF